MTEQTMIFEQKITSLLSKVDEIKYINNGGCAIVAHALVEHIHQNFPRRKAEVVYLMGIYDEYNINRLNNNEVASCRHAIVKTGGKYYDSTGSHSLKRFKAECNNSVAVIVPQDLILSSIFKSEWNRSFEKENDAPKIASIFNINTNYCN